MYLVAIAGPLAVTLLFAHPTRRVLVPALLLLLFVVFVSFVGGLGAGVVAAATSGILLWYFNVPPAYSFRLPFADDAASVAMIFVVGIASAVVVDVLRRRERDAAIRAAAIYAQHVADRSALITLQQALLPTRDVPIPQLEVGWRYLPGGAETPVGGDWLVLVPLSEVRMGIGVGDIAGHGLDAVSAMAQYRFSLRALAFEGAGAARSLGRLEHVMHQFAPDTLASALYGEIDTQEAVWEYAVAGHLPPLLLRSGTAEPLDIKHRGPMIGVSEANEFGSNVVDLRDGDVLVLYSDGLIERRREDLDVGIERLCDRVSTMNANENDLHREADSVVNDLVGSAPADDTLLVLVRFATNA
jgi:serine phosphatase RsbU (regulator of sigma subunit)